MSLQSLPLRIARLFLAALTAAGGVWGASAAHAHIGVVNTQLPYAVAGKSYELVLAVPHGCAYTPPGGVESHADTYKVEVAIPTGFTGVRPIIDGVFGRPVVAKNGAAVTSLTWTKATVFDSSEDDQSYRLGLRGTAPNAPFTIIQFNVKQFCKDPQGGADIVVDWSAYDVPPSNESPKVKIYPARTPGWNKFSVAASDEKHSQAAVTALLTDFFADAQIVWLTPGTNNGTGAWSPNPNTVAKIKSLATKDATYYEIATKADVMIHASDVIWAKF